jgi:FixJ family two-component response regulator
MKTDTSVPLIAIVDGEEAARTAVDSLIRSAGYRSEMFESGIAFLDSKLGQGVSCLIVDLDMPGLNGLKLLRLLRMMNDLLPPTIVFTGSENGLRERGLRCGAIAVLDKPCREEDLLSAIARALQPSYE